MLKEIETGSKEKREGPKNKGGSGESEEDRWGAKKESEFRKRKRDTHI